MRQLDWAIFSNWESMLAAWSSLHPVSHAFTEQQTRFTADKLPNSCSLPWSSSSCRPSNKDLAWTMIGWISSHWQWMSWDAWFALFWIFFMVCLSRAIAMRPGLGGGEGIFNIGPCVCARVQNHWLVIPQNASILNRLCRLLMPWKMSGRPAGLRSSKQIPVSVWVLSPSKACPGLLCSEAFEHGAHFKAVTDQYGSIMIFYLGNLFRNLLFYWARDGNSLVLVYLDGWNESAVEKSRKTLWETYRICISHAFPVVNKLACFMWFKLRCFNVVEAMLPHTFNSYDVRQNISHRYETNVRHFSMNSRPYFPARTGHHAMAWSYWHKLFILSLCREDSWSTPYLSSASYYVKLPDNQFRFWADDVLSATSANGPCSHQWALHLICHLSRRWVFDCQKIRGDCPSSSSVKILRTKMNNGGATEEVVLLLNSSSRFDDALMRKNKFFHFPDDAYSYYFSVLYS